MARISGKIKYFLLMVFMFLTGCANQQPPGGGEIDRVPPKIVEAYPKIGTTNYQDQYVELTFSKYVDKRAFKDAIFISPALEGNPQIEWSGKTARIVFPSELRKNTTYVITVGTDVVDLNNRNRLAQAFTIDFSTGPQIDRRSIAGKVFGEKPEGTMIFCYSFKDSIESLLKHKADFLSQVGSDGIFKLNGLAAGKYLIFAVKDEYRSPVYNADQDLIGIPPYPVTLKAEDSLFSNVNFFVTKYDSIRPRMLNAIMTDRNHLVLNYSETLDSTYLKSSNFHIYDSTTQKKQEIAYIYKTGKPTESILSFIGGFAEGDQVFVTADTLKDIAGNIITNENVSFTVSTKPDTLKPFIRAFKPEPNNEFVDFLYPEFKFSMNKGIDTSKIHEGISF
ncbi:MAG: Ig-like domain-containing protein, partial [Bacteroidota bacterium]|nr:Ig-like domain-containing protein [Bacteroidota bacterium]